MKELLQLVDLYVDLKISQETRSRLINDKIAEDIFRNSEDQKKNKVIAYLNECKSRLDKHLDDIDMDLFRISESLGYVRQCIDKKELIFEKSYKDVLLTKERFLSDKEALLEGKVTISRLVNEISASHTSVPFEYICKQFDIVKFLKLNIPAVGHIVKGVLVSCSPPEIRFDCGYIGTCEDKKLFIKLNNFSVYDVFVVSVCRKQKRCTYSFNKSYLFSLLSKNQFHKFKGRKIIYSNKCLVDIGLLTGKLIYRDRCKSTKYFNLYKSSIDYSKAIFQAAE